MNELVIDAAVVSPTDVALAEHAAVIRALGKRVVGDIIEIGRRLAAAKEIAGHGGWLPWIEREFGWSEDKAEKFMRIAKSPYSATARNLELSIDGLYLLTSKNTPEEVRDAVIERAQNGEALSLKEVQGMVEEAKQKQAADYERRLKALTEKYQREADQLRADIGDALSPDDIQSAINDALAPLQRKIKRLEEERDKRATRKRPDPHGLPATSIIAALHQLALALTITPAQVLEREKMVAQATGQQLKALTAEPVRDAKTVLPWLERFIKEGVK